MIKISMPDVSLVDNVMSDHFSREAIAECGSDHLPLLLIWSENIKADRDHTRRFSNGGLVSLPQMPQQCYS